MPALTAPKPAGRAPHVAGLPRPGQLYAMRDVTIFLPGAHHADEPVWTRAQLREIAANFAEFSAGDDPLLEVPLVIGHGEFSEEQPAVGFATSLTYDERAGALVADFGGIDASTADDIRSRRLYSLSIELVSLPSGMSGTGHVLKRCALLGGGSTPAVKGLGRLPAPVPFGERRAAAYCSRPVPFGAGIHLFADTCSRKDRSMTATRRYAEPVDAALLDQLKPIWGSISDTLTGFFAAAGADANIVVSWLASAPFPDAQTAAFADRQRVARLDPRSQDSPTRIARRARFKMYSQSHS